MSSRRSKRILSFQSPPTGHACAPPPTVSAKPSLLSTLDRQFSPEFPVVPSVPGSGDSLPCPHEACTASSWAGRASQGMASASTNASKAIEVMTVGPSNAQRQWRATTIYDDVPLAAKLFPGRWDCGLFLGLPWAGYASGVNAGPSPVNLIVLAQLGPARPRCKRSQNALRLPVPVFASRSSRCKAVLLAGLPQGIPVVRTNRIPVAQQNHRPRGRRLCTERAGGTNNDSNGCER